MKRIRINFLKSAFCLLLYSIDYQKFYGAKLKDDSLWKFFDYKSRHIYTDEIN